MSPGSRRQSQRFTLIGGACRRLALTGHFNLNKSWCWRTGAQLVQGFCSDFREVTFCVRDPFYDTMSSCYGNFFAIRTSIVFATLPRYPPIPKHVQAMDGRVSLLTETTQR